MGTRLNVLRPGTLPYRDAFALQQRTAAGVHEGSDPTLILLRHPPTYTLGTRADPHNLLSSEQRLASLGAEVVPTDRGGDVTFHGPGQIVGYPILNLRALGVGVSDYVCGLEHALIAALAMFDISGERSTANRGVWVNGAKIAALGVRVARGITTHGFALNVNTDLAWFEHIVPCGLRGVRITSMADVTGHLLDLGDVQDVMTEAFAAQFDLSIATATEVRV